MIQQYTALNKIKIRIHAFFVYFDPTFSGVLKPLIKENRSECKFWSNAHGLAVYHN